MKKQNIILLLLFLLCLELLGCKEKGVEPLLIKNPREYKWAVDTIYPGGAQTIMSGIWASNPNDVYLVGFNTYRYDLWHFDGNTWAFIDLKNSYQIWPTQLSAVYGFSSNDVWAVGWEGDLSSPSSGFIIHYDGSKWREANMKRSYALIDIWGSSPNDVWACGFWGTVYHYDGIKWNKDSVSVYMPQGAEFQLPSITEVNNTAYTIGWKVENNLARWTIYFFKKTNQAWQTLDSFVVAPGQTTFKFGTRLWVSPEGNLYSSGDGVFKWNGNSWDKILASSTSLRGLKGSGDKNIFAVGDYGNVYHYNGNDWYQFQQLNNTNVVYTNVWTDGNEAFICGFTTDSYPMKTIVWHGK